MKNIHTKTKIVDTIAGKEYRQLIDEFSKKHRELEEKYPHVDGMFDNKVECQFKEQRLNQEFQQKAKELLKKYNLI